MKNILVIEDDQSILLFIKRMLEKAEYNVATAINGQDGIEKAAETVPDLIVCDVMLPFVDGFNVLTTLKKSPDTDSIPFVFLTALSQRENVRQGMNLGADDYLTKPFDRKELLAMINSQFKKQDRIKSRIERKVREYLKKSGRTNEVDTMQPNTADPDVLIVEDNDLNMRICQNFFEKAQIPYRTAVNGHEALTRILKKPPAMIFLDSTMPIMDGMDTLNIIRKNPDWSNIHIVMMSTVSSEDEILRLIKSGANDYILKPLKLEFIKVKIDKVPFFGKYMKNIKL